MKNTSWVNLSALRLRLRKLRFSSVKDALAPFAPIGWCAVSIDAKGKVYCVCGGDSVLRASPVHRDTIFRVASVSKVIGAAAAVRLVSRGLLSLDEDISAFLSCRIPRVITLRQLLTHTASIDDTALYDKVIEAPDSAPPLDVVLAKSFLPYAPGTRFRYSNFGAGIAGMMVEAATGMPFDDYIRQEFFAPYGVDASFHPQHIKNKENMANCYRVPRGDLAYDAAAVSRMPLDEKANPLAHYFVPAGKLMISVPDLANTLLRIKREQGEMFALQSRARSVSCDSGRGLGLAFAPRGVFSRDRQLWGHQGVAYGALSEAWIDIGDETTLALATSGARLSAIGPLQKAGQSGIAALLDHLGGNGVY